MRPNSQPTTQWALVSWLFSLLTLETLDSVASDDTLFAGGLATALMEETATWLVQGHSLLNLPLTLTSFSPAPL